MSEKITVPTLGESITEATVSKWLKSVGEQVDSDEPLVELETDKVNVEVPSPLTGTLSSIKVKEGETVKVGTILGTINNSQISKDKDEDVDTHFYHSGIAKRSFDLGYKIARRFDLSKIEGSMKDGLLKLFIPLTPESKPKTVSIK